jgi:DNA-binding transcriptional regulator YiaG
MTECTPHEGSYRYSESGLDWLLVDEGVQVWKTAYGPGISVANLDAIHRAAAQHIVRTPVRLTGSEVRFLRTILDESRTDFGERTGIGAAAVLAIEQGEEASPQADLAVRKAVAAAMGDEDLRLAVERLAADFGSNGVPSVTWLDAHWRDGRIFA